MTLPNRRIVQLLTVIYAVVAGFTVLSAIIFEPSTVRAILWLFYAACALAIAFELSRVARRKHGGLFRWTWVGMPRPKWRWNRVPFWLEIPLNWPLPGRWILALLFWSAALTFLDVAAYNLQWTLPLLGTAGPDNMLSTTYPVRILTAILLGLAMKRIYTVGLTDGVP